MALFDRIKNLASLALRGGSPLDNPAIPLNSSAIWDWLVGGEDTVAGEQINEANSLQITTVYSCITLLASMASTLPLRLMERTDKGHVVAADTGLHYLLNSEPNPEMSAPSFVETMIGCLAMGNCYAQIERNALRQAVALWPLNPLKTEPVRQPNGVMAYKTSQGEPLGTYRIIDAADVIHVPLFSLEGRKGMSPIMLARQSLGLAKAAEKHGARLFGNGTKGGGVFMNKGPKPDPKTQREMKESWQENAGGTNSLKMNFLYGGDWSYQSLGLTPEESQFLATRSFQRADIAALWKISPHLVGDTSRLSGTNSEQLMLQFLVISLAPLLRKLEAELNRKLCPTQGRKAGKFYSSFDVTVLLRTDLKSQNEAYQAGRNGGWYTANDVLRKLGENPGGPECDVYVTAVNYQNSKRLLDTESLQDQPIQDSTSGAALPTPAERSMLGAYTTGYISIYSDSFSRLLTRSKRDYETLSTLFRPVLRSIADAAMGRIGALPDPAGDIADLVINDALRAMAQRAAKWPATIPPADVPAIANAEFVKALRAIHVKVARNAAAAKAVLELAAPEEDTDDQAA
ncbi:MAG TPA: phage portal protein [Acidobacteriaceae bacterium]